MTDRKNLKIDEDTYHLLKDRKGRYQTWDQFFWDEFAIDGEDYDGGLPDNIE